MRLFKKAYDPYPELVVLHTRLHREVMERGTSGEWTPEQTSAALRIVRNDLQSSIVYCTLGRDRKRLPTSYAADTEARVRKSWTEWLPPPEKVS